MNEQNVRRRILVVVPVYLPGYKAGGPIKSIVQLVDHLGEEFDFQVVTGDRDIGDNSSYNGVDFQGWVQVGKASVLYVKSSFFGLGRICEVLRSGADDILYLNSFFNFRFSIFPLILRRIGVIRCNAVVLGPRGEFSSGAISIKGTKKKAFILLSKFLGLHRGIIWQASSEYEKDDIVREIRVDPESIKVAPNVPLSFSPKDIMHARSRVLEQFSKQGSVLRLLFLSRITPKKNLHYALEVLRRVESKVSFTIAGPISDPDYWAMCVGVMRTLPNNVSVKCIGEVHPSSVASLMQSHDLFIFPTRGENYGHVIVEALSNGLPVLLSDTTPWSDLEEFNAGWAFSLDSQERFVQVIENASRWDFSSKEAHMNGALGYVLEKLDFDAVLSSNRSLFSSI